MEGNSARFFFGTLRYQQVYDASEFSAIPLPGHFIHALTFRLNTPSQTFNVMLPDFEVLLSTTTRGPDELSTNFDENSGPDLTRAIDRGTQGVMGVYSPLAQVQGFNITLFPLDRPFFYDPTRGHLLLEIRNYLAVQAADFDNENTLGDSVSSVSSTNPTASSGTAASSGLPTFVNTLEIPRLLAAASSTNLLIQWPRQPSEFVLQRSRALGSNITWNPYQGSIVSSDAFYQVFLPRSSLTNAEYFRLRWDPTYVTNSPVP